MLGSKGGGGERSQEPAGNWGEENQSHPSEEDVPF